MQFILILAIVCALLSVAFAGSACESITNESACKSNSSESCAWCTSGAVGASCMSAADAAGLPSSIFSCSTASAPKFADSTNSTTSAVKPVEPHLSAESACNVANYLRKAGFPSNTIGTMVCISKWESSYNCGATNHNNDGSTDYGLMQINSYYWCSGDPTSKYNECGASCSSMLNCQTNANCAYKVYKEQGYNAWYGYKNHKAECDAAQPPC